MSKKHDENKDLRLIGNKCKVNYYDKTIKAPKSAIIGIKTWGRIDFLVNYCGWMFIWDNSVTVCSNIIDSNTITKRKREVKKAIKEQSLTNKKKR